MRNILFIFLGLLQACTFSEYPGHVDMRSGFDGSPSRGMTAVYIPVGIFPDTITVPQDGDGCSATQLATDVEHPLANGVYSARLMSYGAGPKRRVKCSSNTVMVIQPISAILGTLGGVWRVIQNLTPTTIDPSALTILAASTRYYVYAQVIAGPSFQFLVTTDAPDAGYNYKTGDTSAMWISTFITDAGTLIIPYSQSNLEFFYDQPAGGTDALQLLLNGNATITTTVALNFSVPTNATSFSFLGSLASSLDGRTADIRSNAGGNSVLRLVDAGTADEVQQSSMSLVSGFAFKYFVSNAGAALTVFTAGFTL